MKRIVLLSAIIIMIFTLGVDKCSHPTSNDNENNNVNSKINDQKLPKSADVTTQLGNDDFYTFIKDNSFIGNPNNLLGQVFCVRKKGDKCNVEISDLIIQFESNNIVGDFLDKNSEVKIPNQRSSKILNKNIAAGVNFLSYISSTWEDKEIQSIQVFDQCLARVKQDDKWAKALNNYKIVHKDLFNDSKVCYIFVITGYVQKNIISKTFKSDSLSASGGIYGVKIDGHYYHSDESFNLDIVFGLSSSVLKRPKDDTTEKFLSDNLTDSELMESEKKLLSSINYIIKK